MKSDHQNQIIAPLPLKKNGLCMHKNCETGSCPCPGNRRRRPPPVFPNFSPNKNSQKWGGRVGPKRCDELGPSSFLQISALANISSDQPRQKFAKMRGGVRALEQSKREIRQNFGGVRAGLRRWDEVGPPKPKNCAFSRKKNGLCVHKNCEA